MESSSIIMIQFGIYFILGMLEVLMGIYFYILIKPKKKKEEIKHNNYENINNKVMNQMIMMIQ